MNTCKYILKKGEREGGVCGAGCRNGEFCKSHSERRWKWNKQYYNLNRDQNLNYQKEYKKKYKEEISIQKKKSRCKHWDTVLLNKCRSTDKKHNRYFNLNVEWINKILENQEYKCFHCSKFFVT